MNFGKVGNNGGIVIRVCYNNQEWAGRCKDPVNDPMCSRCVSNLTTMINKGKPVKTANDGYCIGDIMGWCWENQIRVNYTWPLKGLGTTLKKGMDVFLFYRESKTEDHVFFAQTEILQISGEILLFDRDNFVLLPTQKRPSVTKKELEDAIAPLNKSAPKWLQGTYRTINDINKFNQFLNRILQ